MADRSNWGVRYGEALYRIEIVMLIIESFKYYQEVETEKAAMKYLKYSKDYKSCEQAADMIRMLFNRDVNPSELMHTEDDISNSLIDSYIKLLSIPQHSCLNTLSFSSLGIKDKV